MNFPLFIAKRLFKEQSDRKKVSRPAIRIAMAGVAIGLAVMIVSVCVVLGFKHSIRNKIIGFGSQIQVANFMTLQTSESYPIQMGDSMLHLLKNVPGVKHVQRFAMKQGILKTESDFLGVVFKGIAEEYDTTFIHQHLISGSLPRFSAAKSNNQLLVSKIMADKLKLKSGQKIFAYFIDTNAGIKMRRFTISGIYETNLVQYDQSICFTDLYTAVKLNGWEGDQASGAELMVNDFDQIDLSEDYIVKHVNRTVDKYDETYSSKTIQELSPQIFSWLDLLDLNVWIIMALMIAVAGVTMISGLLIIILERTAMIGVLKALGSSNRTIRHTFLWFAFFIIGKGMLIGNCIGFGLVLIQKFSGIIQLDSSIYYINVVPVEINIILLSLLNIVTLLISVFVLVIPSYLISHIHPSKSMRYE